MKRILLIAFLLFWVAPVVTLGQGVYPPSTSGTPCPSHPGNKIVTWYGQRLSTAANDTFYIPDTSSATGFDLCAYSYFSFDFEITDKDTNIADSVFVRVYTQAEKSFPCSTLADVIDSATLAYAFDSSANSSNWANKTRWFPVPDSTNDQIYWDRYFFAQIITKTTGLSGRTYICTTDAQPPEGEVWGAAADSMWDWRTTASTPPETLNPTGELWGDKTDSVVMFNMRQSLSEVLVPTGNIWGAAGDSMVDFFESSEGLAEADIDEGIASIDYSDFISASGPDSACVLTFGDHATGYVIDSVVLKFVASAESTVMYPCTLSSYFLSGDTNLAHFGTFLDKSTPQKNIITTDTTTYRHNMAVSTSKESAWDILQVDSINIGFTSHYVGSTLVNEDFGIIKIYAVDILPYYDSVTANALVPEAAVDEGINAIDYTDFIFAMDQDTGSLFAITDDGGSALYLVDSVVLAFVASVGAAVDDPCTVKTVFMIGDTTGNSWGNIGTESPGVTSAFKKHAIDVDTVTYYHSLVACPTKGTAWGLTQMDSINIGFVIGHGDVATAGGADVATRIYAVDVIPYYENKGLYESEIDETVLDQTDYIFIAAKDSFCAVPATATNDPYEEGQIDSVVVWFVGASDSTLANDDTIKWGLAWGDSSLHHGSMWYTDSLVKVAMDETIDTAQITFALCPSGSHEWTDNAIDSMLFVFGTHYEGQTAATNEGTFYIYQAGYRVYYNRNQSPNFKWKATIRAVE